MREKLVELIAGTKYGKDLSTTVGANFQRSFIERIADHLIANGVTVQQWIPVTERLPLCGERVLITEGTTVFEAYLSISHKWVRAGIGWVENVTHWMPLPDAPKEVAE